MRQLIVVLGAGASFDCAGPLVGRNDGRRPPLVTELFDERFADILHEYPLAEQVAPDIRIAVGSGQLALEAYLRDELRNSEYEHLRRRYFAIPLYLQHLSFEVSHSFTSHPDNYDRLITEALRFERVTFITLNYDTLLDDRLAIDSAIGSIDDYVSSKRRWSLVKLHGSVNWGRAVQHPEPPTRSEVGQLIAARDGVRRVETFAEDFAALREGVERRTSDRIELREAEGLDGLRAEWSWNDQQFSYGRAQEAQLYYPALAVPLGPADELVCPETHVEHVREHQRGAADGLSPR
jgi:hypothetical protein